MSKILDGVAWLAASHGSTLEDVVIKVVIIIIINMGCHDRTELWVSSGVQIAIWISIRSPLTPAIQTRNTSAQFDSADPISRICQSEVWYGQATGCLKSEREELDED